MPANGYESKPNESAIKEARIIIIIRIRLVKLWLKTKSIATLIIGYHSPGRDASPLIAYLHLDRCNSELDAIRASVDHPILVLSLVPINSIQAFLVVGKSPSLFTLCQSVTKKKPSRFRELVAQSATMGKLNSIGAPIECITSSM